MELHGRAQIMQRSADVQNLSAIFFQFRECRPADVERPFQIDIDHGAKAIWRKLLRRAKKITGGPVDYDVDSAEACDGGRQCGLDFSGISDVTSDRHGFSATLSFILRHLPHPRPPTPSRALCIA